MNLPRGIRTSLLVTMAFVVLPASIATAGVLEDRLAETRQDAKQTRRELSVIDQRQQRVVRQVSRLNRELADLQRPLDLLENELEGLEYRIAQRERHIVELKRERAEQAKEIERLEGEVEIAREKLAARVVAAYKTGDVGMIEQLAGAGSLGDLFEREEALAQVVGLDDRVIDRIADAERAVRIKRARNVELRRSIREDIEELDADRASVDGERAKAQAARDAVAAKRAERDAALSKLKAREESLGDHLDDLEEDSKMLQQVIETGTVSFTPGSGGPSSGMIWPVSGPVVSPFGPRWGRLHAGLDIAISAGNPIHAAASGVVIYASWMSGYGNMVLIQHSDSLVTGYAHQSRILTSVGQPVGQGQVIGLVGCTGHCFGDHVHFETRVGGQAVDPMQFL